MRSADLSVISSDLRQQLKRLWTACLLPLYKHTILVLSIIFCSGLLLALWFLSHANTTLIQSAALQGTTLHAETLLELRNLYTSEVVDRVRGHNIEVTHDYLHKPGAIPLPINFSMELARRVSLRDSGMVMRLYSNYPFPWRKDGGVHDDFGRQALVALQANPQQPYYRFEDVEGRASLRYAKADVMQATCVSCHNSRLDSPKRDWKVGDVRGVLEIVRPLDRVVAQSRADLREVSILFGALLALGLGALTLVITRLRRMSVNLEWQVAQLHSHQEELRQSTAQLRDSEAILSATINTALDAVVQMDAAGIITRWNTRAEEIFGWTREEAIGRMLHDTIAPPQYREAHIRGMKHFLVSGEGPFLNKRIEIFALHRDGHEFPIELSITPLKMAGQYEFSSFIRDITERKQAEEQLHIAATAFDSQEGMMVTDANGVILRVNRVFTEITGYTFEEAVGQTGRLLKSGRHGADFYREMWETIKRTGGWRGEIWDRRKNGEVYLKWLTISAVKDNSGAVTHYVGTHSDMTERKIAEEKINELAFFDQLTGLPNRTLLLDRLRQIMTASARDDSYGALLFIDLDNFKTLNDTLGHDMGDLLLKQAAQRLTLCAREGDTVARLGGDEFVLALGGLGLNESEAAIGTEIVAEKVLAALSQAYPLGDASHRCTASVGVTLFKGHLSSIAELMKQADLAMYKSKEAGRNALRFFDPDMETAVMNRAALEKDLRVAIQEKQFLLYYQAQVDGEGRLTGAEVLLRWQHPQRGMVSPAEFIPLAEETGLILPLGLWVLETACTQLALWAARPDMAHLTVAVNVSAHQFNQNDFVDQVLAVLKRTGANPKRLKLELTESLLVGNMQNIIEKMYALKAKGVSFSLDDFGTGYSSLSYLKHLPLEQLKIDQSFVRNVLTDSNEAAIVRTIVALAQSLGLGVIAEGVETAAQRDFMAHSGCHAYQGYFFSRPLPLEGFEAFARQV